MAKRKSEENNNNSSNTRQRKELITGDSLLVIGPDIETDGDAVQYAYAKNSLSLAVLKYGSSKNIQDFDISAFKNIIFSAHGSVSGGKHQMNLKSLLGFENGTEYTVYYLMKLAQLAHEDPINVEIFTCFAGAAIYDIAYLPVGSTLITLAAAERKALAEVHDELIKNHTNPNNQFLKYASYILSNPDDNEFSIRVSDASYYYFSSKISELNDFKIGDIRKWQNHKLDDYVTFLKGIKNTLGEQDQEKVTQVINILGNLTNRISFMHKHDIHRYQELLVLNAFAKKDPIERLEQMLNSDINLDSKYKSGYSLLLLSIKENYNYLTKLLLQKGVTTINDPAAQRVTPLSLAVEKSNKDIVELLLKAGANIEAQNNAGYTPLQAALASKDIKMVKCLLANAANVNVMLKEQNTYKLAANNRAARDELMKYDINPVLYIVQNNKNNDVAWKALNHLSTQAYFTNRERVAEKVQLQAFLAIYEKPLTSEAAITTNRPVFKASKNSAFSKFERR